MYIQHTQRIDVDVSVPNEYLVEFSCRSEIHTWYLIKAHLIGLTDRRAEIPGGFYWGMTHYMRTEVRQLGKW